MIYFKLAKDKLSSFWLMWLAIMLVATWSVYIQDGQINRDGLLYLKQAYLIAEGSWKEGLALYPWPLFSTLIALFHKLTNLHLQFVAHGVDLILFGTAALFYLKTLQLIYNKEKHIIFYGGIILLSFIPIMDDYVGMVLRDHGLWAGCMMGTYFYFKNIKEHSLKNSLMWQFGFLFAGLFRPEGFVFLILIPLWNLCQNKFQNFKTLFTNYVLTISLFILGIFSVVFLNSDLMSAISISRLADFVDRSLLFLSRLIKPLPIRSDDIFLSKLIEDYSLLMTGTFLLSILIFKWIKGLGLLHGALFFYSFMNQKNLNNIYQKHLYFLAFLSFILVCINLFTVYVLTNRYWGFHWWWILILITPFLLLLFENKKISSFIKNILGITLAFFILNSLTDKDKNVDHEVANYLIENSLQQVDFQDNERIKYYVNRTITNLVDNDIENTKSDYSLIKSDLPPNINQHLIIKKFPESKPKYILIKNDY